MKQLLALLVITACLIQSCAVQKRHYRNGYDITFKTSKKNSAKKDDVVQTNIQTNRALVASANQDLRNVVLATTQITNQNDESCDVIYFRNNKVVSAKVVEINSTDIKYKRCDNLDGPLIVVDKNSVKSILYKNGDTETFTESYPIKPIQENTRINKTSPSPDANYDGYAIASFVCGVLFFLLFPAILGFIFGIISLKRIKESDGKLKGKIFALIGTVIGGLLLFITVLALIILIAAILI
jgi:Tfp pilus assembly protein PilE